MPQVISRKLSAACRRRVCGGIRSLQPATSGVRRGFTLIELLVVISILGLLAALSVPALKNLGKSNQAVSAARQLLDDVGRARQLAIANHTTVYMVFVPTNFWLRGNSSWWSSLTTNNLITVTNLSESQLGGYNFLSYGSLGDQPGSHQWQYLSDWQSLPDNNHIAAWKFQSRSLPPVSVNGLFNVPGFFTNAVPFPSVSNALLTLPVVAFNYLGQLTTNGIDPSLVDEYIPLAQGSVAYGYNGATKSPTLTPVTAADVTENPPGSSTSSMFNLVHIDALTGRARLEFQKVQ